MCGRAGPLRLPPSGAAGSSHIIRSLIPVQVEHNRITMINLQGRPCSRKVIIGVRMSSS